MGGSPVSSVFEQSKWCAEQKRVVFSVCVIQMFGVATKGALQGKGMVFFQASVTL